MLRGTGTLVAGNRVGGVGGGGTCSVGFWTGSSVSAGGAGGATGADFTVGAGDAGFAGSMAAAAGVGADAFRVGVFRVRVVGSDVRTGGGVTAGFALGCAGSTHSDCGGGGVFISSDQRLSMTVFFSAGGGAGGSNAGATTGPVPVHPLSELRQFVQHSPSGLGSPQTAQRRSAGFVSA